MDTHRHSGAAKPVDPRLGHWLRAVRRSISVEQLGLAVRERRRSPQLTQVEVARLAGVTPRAYQGIEQGSRRPGTRVLKGITTALRLNPAQVTYMRLLSDPDRPSVMPRLPTAEIQRLLDNLSCPAVAYDHTWRILASNVSFQAALPLAGHTNLLLWYFLASQARQRFLDWHAEAHQLVARFRMIQAHFCDTKPFAHVINRLRTDPYARQLWDHGVDVSDEPTSRTYRLRTDAGSCTRTVLQLRPVDTSPTLRVAVCLPEEPATRPDGTQGRAG